MGLLQKVRKHHARQGSSGFHRCFLVTSPSCLFCWALCIHVLGVSACHSHTRVCCTSSIPFPIACSTARTPCHHPFPCSHCFPCLLLLVALLCITHLIFQFMMVYALLSSCRTLVL